MKRGEQHLESSIPLILIAILAVFVAAKFNFIDCSSIPGLSVVCPAASIKVVVIGNPSTGIETLLNAQDFRMAGVTYMGNIDQADVYPGTLDQFDIIILQGQQICDRTSRMVIANRVKAGGKMIVIQDACTKVSDDTTVVGWDIGIGALGDVMPVQIGGYTRQYEPIKKTSITGNFKIIPINHPIFPSGQKDFSFTSSFVQVLPSATVASNILAFVDVGSSTSSDAATQPAYFAMVESNSLLSGKVIYFAYDPSSMVSQDVGRNLFLNTLLYLKGSKG